MWDQIKVLAANWRSRFVLGSGSLAKFWENERILGAQSTETLPSMIPVSLRDSSSAFERKRVQYRTQGETLNLEKLCDWVQTHESPRMLVMNTVQSAAVAAKELRGRGIDTLHLSTALAPIHRNNILKEVQSRLTGNTPANWILVATSCVEAGVNLSFHLAFRERCSAASLVQIGGRVNRHGERDFGTVWDFVAIDPQLTPHPDFKHSRSIVQQIFAKQMWDNDLTTLMTYALKEEFKLASREEKIKDLAAAERSGKYPAVAQLTRLITADTRTVVVEPALISAIRLGAKINQRDLIANSVQIWFTKIKNLALSEIGFGKELYAWEYEYDADFLGYMAGILKLKEIDREGYAFI
jgi:CRISPR-associated endonuclease/helicase Cas3